jgi:hypothetical protein
VSAKSTGLCGDFEARGVKMRNLNKVFFAATWLLCSQMAGSSRSRQRPTCDHPNRDNTKENRVTQAGWPGRRHRTSGTWRDGNLREATMPTSDAMRILLQIHDGDPSVQLLQLLHRLRRPPVIRGGGAGLLTFLPSAARPSLPRKGPCGSRSRCACGRAQDCRSRCTSPSWREASHLDAPGT